MSGWSRKTSFRMAHLAPCGLSLSSCTPTLVLLVAGAKRESGSALGLVRLGVVTQSLLQHFIDPFKSPGQTQIQSVRK